jgi:NTP pyrophosphatase (non-canonical NTP hydrolase)
MEFNEYQEQAKTTAQYPHEEKVWGVIYTSLGLAGEAGELANKVKKIIRDDNWSITYERRLAILDELGDVLWYASELARALGANLDDVALKNLQKLRYRRENNKVHGDGDNR